jgi:hypothetical protein
VRAPDYQIVNRLASGSCSVLRAVNTDRVLLWHLVQHSRSACVTILGFAQRRRPASEKHIVPPERWNDPEWGEFFRRIGQQPDDPSNRFVTNDDVVQMIDEGRKTVDARIHQLQAKASAKGLDIRLRAFWLIQDSCWNGEVGDFLIYHLRLNPYEEWNTVILPADASSSVTLDMPMHPGADIPAFAKAQNEVILSLRDRLRAAHEQVQRTHEFGKFADLCDDTVARVKELARRFSALLVEGHQKFPPSKG